MKVSQMDNSQSTLTGCRKCKELDVRGNTKNGEEKQTGRVSFSVSVCVCSAVHGVNLGEDRLEKTLQIACRVVLLFWASA